MFLASSYGVRHGSVKEFTVGYLLYILCENLEDRISRRSVFYKKSTLIKYENLYCLQIL